MKILTAILTALLVSCFCDGQGSLSIDDFLSLPSIPDKKIDRYLGKKGFFSVGKIMEDDVVKDSFSEKIKLGKKDTLVLQPRRLEYYKNENSLVYTYHTYSKNEFENGVEYLVQTGFTNNDHQQNIDTISRLFQKGNLVIETNSSIEEESQVYTFRMKKKELPAPNKIQFAEDLLVFDSHEYLASFFGKNNVKKDLYYLSEKELKSCSVIFGNSKRQAVFVWNDETNMRDLAYILISDVIPTVQSLKFDGTIYNNEWQLKNGIRSGMSLTELLRLNKNDFNFYGGQSANEYMVVPGKDGMIDFKNNHIVLGCNNCAGASIFNSPTVSALTALQENSGMYVYYIILFPKNDSLEAITKKN